MASQVIGRGVAPATFGVGERTRFVVEHPWLFVLSGAAAGCVLGVLARAWMRWISVDPEFSWAGTLAIVSAFTVFAAVQAAAATARLRPARPVAIVVARVIAAVLSLGLFGAAGAVMFPTVLFGSLAMWRRGLGRVPRTALTLLALPSVGYVILGIVDDLGWSLQTIGRIVVFVSIYTMLVAATWPTVAPVPGGLRMSRRLLVGVAGVGVALAGVALYFGGIE